MGNISGEQRAPQSAMNELISSLESGINQLNKNADGYRAVLGRLEDQTLSWEGPQDCESESPLPKSEVHLSRFVRVLGEMNNVIKRQTEILEHYQRLF